MVNVRAVLRSTRCSTLYGAVGVGYITTAQSVMETLRAGWGYQLIAGWRSAKVAEEHRSWWRVALPARFREIPDWMRTTSTDRCATASALAFEDQFCRTESNEGGPLGGPFVCARLRLASNVSPAHVWPSLQFAGYCGCGGLCMETCRCAPHYAPVLAICAGIGPRGKTKQADFRNSTQPIFRGKPPAMFAKCAGRPFNGTGSVTKGPVDGRSLARCGCSTEGWQKGIVMKLDPVDGWLYQKR